MLPTSWLTTTRPEAAPAGSLLLPYGGDCLQLRVDDTAKLAVRLDGAHPRAFSGINIEGRHIPVLSVVDWHLRVDHASAYSVFDGHPEAGHAFMLNDGTTGFVIRLDHATRYLTMDGRLIPEPNFGQVDYMGFRSWSVGKKLDDQFIELVAVNGMPGDPQD